MSYSYKVVGVHRCFLHTSSNSALPDLSPRSNIFTYFWRALRKQMLPSYLHYQTKYYFRSKTAMLHEKVRMVKQYPSYIIHPFSLVNIVRETFMCSLWLLLFITRITYISFYYTTKFKVQPFQLFCSVFVNIMLILNMAMLFITGFKTKSKTICLEPKQIIRRYLKSYFVIDLIDAFPTIIILRIIQGTLSSDFTAAEFYLVHVVVLVRIRTTIQYFGNALYLFNVPKHQHGIIVFSVLTIIMLHWSACLIYIVPKYIHPEYNIDLIPNSYMQKMRFNEHTKIGKYVFCVHKVICLFYKSGRGFHGVVLTVEAIVYSFVLIISYGFHIYIIIYILEWFKMMCNPENKFAAKLGQLDNYLTFKNYNIHLKYRIMLYFHHKFQNKYFKENVILASLSEHLRHEMFLHSCTHIISQVAMFRGLSKFIIGHIVAVLEPEIFLPNDMIFKTGDPGEYIYFISYGLVAAYTAAGNEIMHLEDGDILGSVAFHIGAHTATIVAIDLTEVFRWNKSDILKTTALSPEVLDKIISDATVMQEKVINVDIQQNRDENYIKIVGRRKIVEDLKLRETQM